MISQLLFNVQESLFPHLELCLGPLSDKEKKLVEILEFSKLDDFFFDDCYVFGRPPSSRMMMARAFVAKAAFNISRTSDLIERLRSSVNLRIICGYEGSHLIPSESTFSRAFQEFAAAQLPERIHALMIETFQKEKLVGHISRDSTSVVGREKAVYPKIAKAKKKTRKPGRPKKGETVKKEQKFIERQKDMSIEEILSRLPSHCNHGVKKDSKGFKLKWRGYKLHLDVTDSQIPVSCVLTSASVHDSQVAIPLSKMTRERVDHCYELMDAAYDCKEIKDYISSKGQVPIIDANQRRGGLKIEMSPAKKIRYRERSGVERVNSRLKDEFGLRTIMVKGAKKVMAHIMFSIIALTADQFIRMVP